MALDEFNNIILTRRYNVGDEVWKLIFEKIPYEKTCDICNGKHKIISKTGYEFICENCDNGTMTVYLEKWSVSKGEIVKIDGPRFCINGINYGWQDVTKMFPIDQFLFAIEARDRLNKAELLKVGSEM